MAVGNGSSEEQPLLAPHEYDPESNGDDAIDEPAVPLELLQTPAEGLSSEEALVRLERFGKNRLEDKQTSKWLKLVQQFTGPMPFMIWLAIGIEAGIEDWPNVGVLLALQLINGLVGWLEEAKAGDAIAALKQSLQPKAHVTRDGLHVTIDADVLVPGDRVTLAAGAAVPADCMLVPEAKPIQVDQAALTGESMPVTMGAGDVAKMGSNVVRGECEAVVSATGSLTFFGKTASLISSVDDEGHFQQILMKITLGLLLLSLVLVGTCMGWLLSKKEPFLEVLAFCVVLLVASIPIAMQVVCTTTMALGSRTLATKKVIVSRLGSIEELAGMDMLCSDKTGTLTLNKMELQEEAPTFAEGVTRADVLRAAALAAKWREPPKDALDTLVLKNVDLKELDDYQQPEYSPFDPAVKMTSATVVPPGGAPFDVAKGAPQVILRMAHNAQDIGAEVERTVAGLAERGIRCLAVARTGLKPNPNGWTFMGILTFLDPPRPDTRHVIERAHELGIGVKMITGDQRAIAVETCRTLGMGTTIMGTDVLPQVGNSATGAPLALPSTLGADFGEVIESADGFAEVFPEHKFLIVEVLKQRGFQVGMTGDGVNDAPALKKAGIGIAVEGATDAARAAADIVLISPGLSVIIEAIAMSREIFQRMKNYVIYRIACTIQLLLFFFIGVLSIQPRSYHWPTEEGFDIPPYFKLPVIALVVITILNDGCIISIAYDTVLAAPKPEKWRLKECSVVSSVLGIVAVGSSILLLSLSLSSNDAGSPWQNMGLKPVTYRQAMMLMYLKISLSDFLTVFAARTHGFFWSRMPGTFLLCAAVVATSLSTLIAVKWDDLPLGDEMASIPGDVAFYTWLYCLAWFFIQDCVKVGLYELMYRADFSGVLSRDRKQQRRSAFRRARRASRLSSRRSSFGGAGDAGRMQKSDMALRIAAMEGELNRLKSAVAGMDD